MREQLTMKQKQSQLWIDVKRSIELWGRMNKLNYMNKWCKGQGTLHFVVTFTDLRHVFIHVQEPLCSVDF